MVLDRGLPVVTQPCIGPQQLLDGHPGVSCPHRGRVNHWLHHQAGQQRQESCVGEPGEILSFIFYITYGQRVEIKVWNSSEQ